MQFNKIQVILAALTLIVTTLSLFFSWLASPVEVIVDLEDTAFAPHSHPPNATGPDQEPSPAIGANNQAQSHTWMNNQNRAEKEHPTASPPESETLQGDDSSNKNNLYNTESFRNKDTPERIKSKIFREEH